MGSKSSYGTLHFGRVLASRYFLSYPFEHTCHSSSHIDLNVSDEERRKFLKWKANTAKMISSRNQRDHQHREEATNQSMLAITSKYQVHGDQMRIHFRRDQL